MFKDGEIHEENGVVDSEMEDIVGSSAPQLRHSTHIPIRVTFAFVLARAIARSVAPCVERWSHSVARPSIAIKQKAAST